MKPRTRVAICASALALGSVAALAQSVISARSGLIHYIEGRVLLGDQEVRSKFGEFPEVKENATLRTEEGRAEVLLTPGVFLRLAEHSSFRMVTNRLIDTRLELLTGSAVIEAADVLKDNSVTVVLNDSTVQLTKRGLYRLDAQTAELRVYDGEVEVQAGGKAIEVKGGKMLRLDGELAVEKFDTESGDALSRWSRRRAEYIAMANVSAARSIHESGMSWTSSAWRWNPYFGMFTFIPMSGAYTSPYGYRFWSPGAVYQAYMPRVVYRSPSMGSYDSSVGYRTMPRTSGGYSGTVAAAPPSVQAPTTSSAGAASAPVSRGSGSGGGSRR
jgi:hypothetical protein